MKLEQAQSALGAWLIRTIGLCLVWLAVMAGRAGYAAATHEPGFSTYFGLYSEGNVFIWMLLTCGMFGILRMNEYKGFILFAIVMTIGKWLLSLIW